LKRLIVTLMSVMLVLFGITADYTDSRPMPERIINTVLVVEQSSGVIVYSDQERALILTAHHVIDQVLEKALCCGCNYGAEAFVYHDVSLKINKEEFDVTYIDFDEFNDLAIVEIKTSHKFRDVARIYNKKVHIGTEVYVGSNPQHIYRSLKKGIISSPLRIVNGSPSIETDAGIIYGSSGGGVFTMDGRLIGIVKSVRLLSTEYCYDLWDVEGEWTGYKCVKVPLPFIGFAAHPTIIKKFLLNSVFSEDFNYLK